MDSSEAIKKLLPAFEHYYTLKTDNVVPPFSAEAEFHSHGEQYMLVKSAHVADIDSHEYLFFAEEDSLSTEKLDFLVKKAWEEGLSRIKPYYGHRNSDIALFIFANQIEETASRSIKKIKLYKSYKFSIYGWSHFKIVAVELNDSKYFCNRQGGDFMKLIKQNLGGVKPKK